MGNDEKRLVHDSEQALVDEAVLFAQTVVEPVVEATEWAVVESIDDDELPAELVEMDEEAGGRMSEQAAEVAVPEEPIVEAPLAIDEVVVEPTTAKAMVEDVQTPIDADAALAEESLEDEAWEEAEEGMDEDELTDEVEQLMAESEQAEDAMDAYADEEELDEDLENDAYVSAPDVELKEAASLAHAINSDQGNAVGNEIRVEPSEAVVVAPDNHVTRLADTINKSASVAQSLVQDDDTSVGNSMRTQPIADLKSAITIVDRFRFQRELFNGDGEKMMKTISDLNGLSNLDAAENYIAKHFQWSEENSTVADFLSLVRRRFQE